jgi:hypothetical protein
MSTDPPGTSREALIAFAVATARHLTVARAVGELDRRPDGQAGYMHGAAGVAAFLAEVGRAMGAPWALAAARAWLRAAHAFAAQGDDAFADRATRELMPGFAEGVLGGRGGLAWAGVAVAEATGDRVARSRAIAALRDAHAAAPRCFDITRGKPGFAEASRDIMASHDGLTRDDLATLRRLATSADRGARELGRIASADTFPVAHGVAGLLLVLLRSPRHAALARRRLAAFARLEVRDPRGLSSYPIRPGLGPGDLIGSWCNGITGVLQLFLRAAARARLPPSLDHALLEAALTTARLPAENHTLCCGAAGRALILADAARHFGSPELRRRSRALLTTAMRRASAAPPGVFSGRAGIAWVALVLAVPHARRPLPFTSAPLELGRGPLGR